MSLPITAVGPLNVLTKPILTDLPWASAGPAASARIAPAGSTVFLIFHSLPLPYPNWPSPAASLVTSCI